MNNKTLVVAVSEADSHLAFCYALAVQTTWRRVVHCTSACQSTKIRRYNTYKNVAAEPGQGWVLQGNFSSILSGSVSSLLGVKIFWRNLSLMRNPPPQLSLHMDHSDQWDQEVPSVTRQDHTVSKLYTFCPESFDGIGQCSQTEIELENALRLGVATAYSPYCFRKANS